MLLAGALTISLAFGSVFLALHHAKDLHGAAIDPPANPLDDDQSKVQVIDTARQFVAAGRMRGANGSYLLMPCREGDAPLYQGSLYLNFDLPTIQQTPAYFREIARNLSAGGWQEGIPPGHHPGGKVLSKDGIAAVFYRHPDVPERGVLQIYGECRDIADHRMDPGGFVDVSRELYAGRR